MLISKKAVEEYIGREFKSYYWMKKLTERELLAELDKLEVKPEFKTKPWAHQLVSFFIGLVEPRWLFNLDMGAGKSKVMLDLMTQFRREGRLTKKALVMVPRLINLASWENAILEHSNLTAWMCTGGIVEKQDRLLNPQGDVSVIDYMGLQLATTQKKGKKLVRDEAVIRKLQKVYDFIVIDESHKVKNKDTLRYGIVNQLTKHAQFVYEITGTVFGRNVEDFVPQFYLLDRGETFQTLGLFRAAFCTEKQDFWSGTVYQFDPKKTHLFTQFIQNKSIRYEADECNDLPKCTHVQIKCNLAEQQRKHYTDAVDGVINTGGQLGELEGAWIRLRQIASGYLQWKDEYGEHVIDFDENSKLEALEDLIESCGDSKIVVSYEYTATGKRITDMLTRLKIKHRWLYGGTKDHTATIRQFISDPEVRVFVMNSEAGGTGVDGLQKVARYLVFVESPCSPITRKQTEKRIDRPGQLHRTFIYDLVMQRTIDHRILSFIKEGNDLHAAVMGRGKKDLKNWLTSS